MSSRATIIEVVLCHILVITMLDLYQLPLMQLELSILHVVLLVLASSDAGMTGLTV